MKVCTLKGWPPNPDGIPDAFNKLPSPDEAIIYKVIYCRLEWLTFICEFGDELYAYDYHGEDTETCEALKRILEENAGKRLSSIGEIELHIA